jgi:hypothetical protein
LISKSRTESNIAVQLFNCFTQEIIRHEVVLMLNTEQKRQIFIKLRRENFQASLRLEGFQVSTVIKPVAVSLAELKARYAR